MNGDRAIASVFAKMSKKFEDEIESLKAQIEGTDADRATFAQLVAFSKNLLVDIASA